MESNTLKNNYFDKIEENRELFKGQWFEYLTTLIQEVISDVELSNDDTKELIQVLNDELQSA